MRAAVLVVITWTLGVGAAQADRREASLHAHLVAGAVTLGDDRGDGSGAVGGVATRTSYATSNLFQYDAELSVLAGRASFDSATFAPPGRPSVTGPFTRSAQAARLDAGVTFRFGVRWIPTARLAAGVQLVRRGAPTVDLGTTTAEGEDATGVPADVTLNLIGTATLGLDYRINRRVIIGAAAGTVLGAPGVGPTWRSFDVTVHGAWYWYPRF